MNIPIWPLLLVLAACTSEPQTEPLVPEDPPPEPSSSSTTDPEQPEPPTTDASEDTEDTEDPTFPRWDFPPIPDAPGNEDTGCQKVDVIMAVDNSGSGAAVIDVLQGPVFDALPETLLAINDGIEDFQLAVIDACPKPAYFHDEGSSGFCDFSTGKNYMSSGSPDLAEEFACVSTFDTDGYSMAPDACVDAGNLYDDDEQAGLTAAEAVSQAALDEANDGFLRDDAILFVITITDEDEALVDTNNVQQIYDKLVEAKGGNKDAIAYLGVAGDSYCEGPYGWAIDAVNAKALAGLFEADGNGMFWDICGGNLEEAFEMAIEQFVDEVCGGFNPPE